MLFRIEHNDVGTYRSILAAYREAHEAEDHGQNEDWFDQLLRSCDIVERHPESIQLALGENGQISAFCQLFPTFTTHPSDHVFAEELGLSDYPKGDGVYELTPVTFDKALSDRRTRTALFERMVAEVVSVCRTNKIHKLIVAANTASLTGYLRSGLDVVPLGLPSDVAGQMVVPLQVLIPETRFAAQ